MRSRVTAAGGRSPGSRVVAFNGLPRHLPVPSGISAKSSPLTVAGAAAELPPRSLLILLRGTTIIMLTVALKRVKHRDRLACEHNVLEVGADFPVMALELR